MLFSPDGEPIYQEFSSPPPEAMVNRELWTSVVRSLDGVREAEWVYEKSRLYIRETEIGYLMILTGIFTPIAKIRLHCDVLLPYLARMDRGRGLKRFFSKKK